MKKGEKMASQKRSSIFFKNYIVMIQNSLETRMFRNFYTEVDGEEKDILENGRLSCAVFVSSILILKGLIKGPPRGPHAMVKSLVKNMEDSGWRKIRKPRPGAVLVWEPMKIGERANDHIGFFLEGTTAISNNSQYYSPIKHDMNYGLHPDGAPIRKIIAIYWHDKLCK